MPRDDLWLWLGVVFFCPPSVFFLFLVLFFSIVGSSFGSSFGVCGSSSFFGSSFGPSLAAPAAPSGFSAGAPSGFSAGDVGVISGSLSSSAIGILFLTDLDLAGRACGTRRTASSIQEFAPAMVLRWPRALAGFSTGRAHGSARLCRRAAARTLKPKWLREPAYAQALPCNAALKKRTNGGQKTTYERATPNKNI